MRVLLKYIVVCLLCLVMLIPSACAPREQVESPTPTPEQTPTASQPSPEPTDTPEPEEPVHSEEPLPVPDLDPVPAGDVPAVHPDEETELAYDLDGIRGRIPAVHHCNIHGYSIIYDAIHYERRSYEGSDTYWSEEGLYLSVSLFVDCSIDFIMDGLMLQENIEMAPRSTVVSHQGYPAYTFWHTTQEGNHQQFWVLDYNGSALLIEQSYPVEHEFADFHRAVQQAMIDSIALVEHDSEAIAALQAVLKDGQPVVPVAGGDAVTLEQHLAQRIAEAGADMEYIAYTYCDLDRDGGVELILCHTIGEADAWFDILRWQDGTVYLYERPYRGLLQLKTDGTFHYSSGAANSGIATLHFEGTDTVTDPITWVESDDNIEVRYFVDGVPADAAEFDLAAAMQAQKSAVVWYIADGE